MNKFLMGLILGITIAGGLAVYLSNTPIEFTNKNVSSSNDSSAIEVNRVSKLAPGMKLREQKADVVEDQDVPDKPGHDDTQSYDFFDVLQSKRVSEEKLANAPKPQVKIGATRFYVQAGSYTSYPEAEDAKAQIAFMGLDAKIIKDKSGPQQINRVVLGPISSEDLANQLKDRLRNEGMNATIVKQN